MRRRPNPPRTIFWCRSDSNRICTSAARDFPRVCAALAGALVHDPRLIILDEPLTGLDALSARHVKGLLQERVRAGCTVIMTTHILEVAERMADRIGVIAAGRLVAEGTLAELRQQNGRNDTSLEDMFIALVDAEAAAA